MTRFVEWLLAAIFVLIFCYLFFGVAFTHYWAEAKCLEKGFPKSKVTYKLDAYCIAPDGPGRAWIIEL